MGSAVGLKSPLLEKTTLKAYKEEAMWELYIGNFYFYKLCIQYLKIHQVMGHTGAQQSVVSIPECSRARREVLA